jgi:hypothetical protein
MKEMRRLTGASPNPVTRSLLRAGRADAPSEDGRRRAAVAMGIAGGIAMSSTTAAATGGATGAAAVSKWVGTGAFVKWTTAAIAGAVLAGGAVAVEVTREHDEALPSASARSVPALAAAPSIAHRQPTHAPAPAAVEVPSAPAEVVPSATAVPDPPLPSHGRPVAPHPSRDGSTDASRALGRELALLDGARVALQEGRPRGALAELDDYARAFPRGALAEEARVLRIEALAESGERAAAVREAQNLLARDPDSPHAARVRGVLASLSSETGSR